MRRVGGDLNITHILPITKVLTDIARYILFSIQKCPFTTLPIPDGHHSHTHPVD